jgi:Flp pilus assembly protein TadB
MRRLSDTGKQIDEDIRRRYGRAQSEMDTVRRQNTIEDEEATREQPAHPIAAVGATFLIIGALLTALVLTAVFAVSAFVLVPTFIAAVALVGAWAFWSWGRRRRARRESSTVPGDALPDE